MLYYDISPVISPDFAVFPGDIPFSLTTHSDLDKGHSCTLATMQSTLHVGAHADAPSHYHLKGTDIANRPLYYYFGNCQVIDVTKTPRVITKKDIEFITITEPRVLLKTNSWINHNQWQNDFISITCDAVDFLASQGIILIGIDTPSVDAATASDLSTHRAIYAHDMAVLECLLLRNVPAGSYSLVALPLPISKGEASPVRAILLPHNTLPKLTEDRKYV